MEATVDFSVSLGKLKNLNGFNNGVITSGHGAEKVVPMQRDALRSMHPGSIRLHDVPSATGRPYVDPGYLFPLHSPAADPNDPDWYFFGPTDDYLDIIETCGEKDMEIVWRLGPSAEHTYPRQIHAHAPHDLNRYAEACAGVMRHALAGWGGRKRRVRYWEIWNEPDLNGKTFWERPVEEFYPFYCLVAKRLKREFDRPDVLIGGPAFSNYKPEIFEAFLKYISKEKAPLDFFSFHTYLKDWDLSWPDRPIDIAGLKAMLTKYGYGKAEIHLNEWHYFPCKNWGEARSRDGQKRWFGNAPDGAHGIESAAMTARCMTKWSDAPLDVANFYSAQNGSWSFFRDPNGTCSFYPEAWPLKFFGEMRMSVPERVRAESSSPAMTVLASKGKGGRRALLVSVYRCGADRTVELVLKGVPPNGRAKIRTLVDGNPPNTSEIEWANGRMVLPDCNGSAVYFIGFKE